MNDSELNNLPLVVIIVGVIVLLLLLFLSAIMSSSEVAFFSLTKKEIDDYRKSNKTKYKRIVWLYDHPDKLLATILTGNNFINIAFVVISFWFINLCFDLSLNPVLSFIFQTLVITFLVVTFGEIIPKTIATVKHKKIVELNVNIIYATYIIFIPIVHFLTRSTQYFRKKIKKTSFKVNVDDISNAIELTENDLKDEKKILKGIVNFTSIRVNEIMIPRIDVKTVNINDSFALVVQKIKEYGFSRIPVINNSFDQIEGILYIKDLLPHLHKSEFKWQSLIRSPYYVPESKFINDLLNEFQQKKIHMAIVVDEYGGSSGIVTLEDVLEEIVGNIDDEFDVEEKPLYTQLNDYTFEVDGKMLINDFCNIANIEDNIFDDVKSDAETIAGLILQHTGSIPENNFKVNIAGIEFIVKQSDNRRIKKVQIILPHEN